MRPVRVFPDVELVLTSWLRQALADHGTPARVATTLPERLEAQLPLVQVQRVGGSMRYPLILDEARVDVDCYHRTRADAAALAATVRALLASLPGTTTGGALVAQLLEDVAPAWRPDPVANVRRFGTAIRVMTRPA